MTHKEIQFYTIQPGESGRYDDYSGSKFTICSLWILIAAIVVVLKILSYAEIQIIFSFFLHQNCCGSRIGFIFLFKNI